MANAKLKLGNAPKTFTKVVEIPLLDGDVADVKVTYKYRTKSEFAALMDSIIKKENEPSVKTKKGAKAEDSPKSITEIYAETDADDVDFVLQVAEGWDLEDEFSAKSLTQLENEFPGSLRIISETYRIAVSEGRAKN